jgi:hypothetical protein
MTEHRSCGLDDLFFDVMNGRDTVAGVAPVDPPLVFPAKDRAVPAPIRAWIFAGFAFRDDSFYG